jgi:D-lactate dehydrogenase (cytochrome)
MANLSIDRPGAEQIANAVAELKSLLGHRSNTSEAVREHHSKGESYHPPALPDIVCSPRSTDEVSRILQIGSKYRLPVIPFGAGTSVEAQVNAIHGGISIDMREMNRISRINPEDLSATVEAGVTKLQLVKALLNTGTTFFVDPGTDCTIGGMASTRASGTTTVRYGTMRENVLGLTVVLADGRIIKTGTRAPKSAAGYDLTHLFVGAEGTLGVITEVIVRLHPLPEAVSVACCSFETIKDAVETVIETIQLGIAVARIELLDEAQVHASNRFSNSNLPVAPTLFLEFHGASIQSVGDQAQVVQGLTEEHHGKHFQWVTTPEEREALWKIRHDALYAALALRPGSKAYITDVCVPISRLAECIVACKADVADAPFPTTIVGHVGDGNFHMLFMLDPESPEELAAARQIEYKIISRALDMEGTCTGEHGIGNERQEVLVLEHGHAVDVMRAIKAALDSENLMNPGKMFQAG